MKAILTRLALLPLLAVTLAAQSPSAPAAIQPAKPVKLAASRSSSLPAAISAITEADLKRDLYAMAGDGRRGREAGTLDELRASMWVTDQFRAIGVAPKGEDGTYFQWWNMRRTRISTISSSVSLDGKPLALWTEISPTTNLGGDASAQTVFVGDGRDTTVDVKGKVAVVIMQPPTAVIVVADSIADIAYDGVWKLQERGAYDVVGGVPRNAPSATPAPAPRLTGTPVLFVRRSSLGAFRENGHTVEIHLRVESFESPSVNIIGVVRGTDPKLRDEYVLFSSHQDHDGVRFVVNGDSIWNGADDNASTSVALLAIARAFVKQPGKRSAQFVFHGAEERGLLGSQPPHRNSTELVQMALDANAATGAFIVDSLWDRPTHPEGWYFRSDHVPYACLNVPALMFSTNLHPDYHTPRDGPENINYPKLTHMTKWMFMTGWLAANAAKRPAIDPGFKLER